jgi:hypothetical protein
VKGTRILAETILGYLRADYSAQAIFHNYPSLPVDGIDAVARWAEETYVRTGSWPRRGRPFVEGSPLRKQRERRQNG